MDKQIEQFWERVKSKDDGKNESINMIKFYYGSIDNYRKSCEETKW